MILHASITGLSALALYRNEYFMSDFIAYFTEYGICLGSREKSEPCGCFESHRGGAPLRLRYVFLGFFKHCFQAASSLKDKIL